MTEQTEGAEVGIPKRIHDLAAHGVWVALGCDKPEQYALCEQLADAALAPAVEILAAAEARGAQAALLMAAIEVRVVRENGLPEGVNSHPTSEAFEDWLRARAAVVAARGAEGGAGA